MFNIEIKVNIQAETMEEAIEKAVEEMAQALRKRSVPNAQAYNPPVPTPSTPAPVPTVAVVPTAPPIPVPMPTAPVATVPTSTLNYTFDQIAGAAAALADSGKREPVLALIAHFGAPSLSGLPQEQYGAFAIKLRELGAQI